MIVINKEVKALLDAHDEVMEMGFKGIMPMGIAEEIQLKLQAAIMVLRDNQQEK